MKRLMVCVLFVLCIGLDFSTALAGDCYSDMVVRRWIEERDKAEERVVQAWAKGASPEQFASGVAIILSNEFYICSKCRDDSEASISEYVVPDKEPAEPLDMNRITEIRNIYSKALETLNLR